MRTALLIFLVSFSAIAANPAKYLEKASGVLLTGLTERRDFDFVGGQTSECEKTLTGGMLVYKCDVQDAIATIGTPGNNPLVLTFDKVSILYRAWHGKIYRDYMFSGQWQESARNVELKSKVSLQLMYNDSEPNDISGSLGFVKYDQGGSIQAKPE